MLFILRNIRRKLLTNNKVTTYLLYAIGEIVLVVFGILIAVSIDNWNQQRILESDATELLYNIQQNLLKEIEDIDEMEAYYINKDSLLHEVIYTPRDLSFYAQQETPEYAFLMTGYDLLIINTDPWNKLVDLESQLPEKFKDVYGSLKELYKSGLYGNEFTQENITSLVKDYHQTVRSFDWYSDYAIAVESRTMDFPTDFYRYLTDNKQYLNKMHHYHQIIRDDFARYQLSYRHFARLSYMRIAKFLGQDIIPESAHLTPLLPANIEKYLGTYHNKQIDVTAVISVNDNEVMLNDNYRVYVDSNGHWVTGAINGADATFVKLVPNKEVAEFDYTILSHKIPFKRINH